MKRLFLFQLTILSLIALSFNVNEIVNLINKGDMEDSSGWSINPRSSDLVLTYVENEGVNGSMAMRLSTTTMGDGNFYVVSNNTAFPLNNNDDVTITFWARASSDDMSILTYLQESDNNFATTNFQTLTLTTSL